MEGVVVSKLMAMFALLVCSLVASFLPYKFAGILKRWDQRQREKEEEESRARQKIHINGRAAACATTDTRVDMKKDTGFSHGDGDHAGGKQRTIPKSERIISMMICFSGGVLLAVAMIHMLPEVRNDIGHAMDHGKVVDTRLPLAEMVFCSGFLAVYFVERFVRFLVKRKDERDQKRISAAIQPSVLPLGTLDDGNARFNSSETHNVDLELAQPEHETLGKKLGHFFIILALSFHSIFEGLAIGLQENSRSVWLLFVGVGAHKFLLAFCIGMELFSSGQQSLKMASGYLITFAVMSPIGVAMGLGVVEEIANDPGTQSAVVGVLQGLAGGTLVYVTFFELLNEQSEKVKSMPAIYSFMEWAMFICGFAFMTIIDSAASVVDPTVNSTPATIVTI